MPSLGPVLPLVGQTDSSIGLAAWANANNILVNDGATAGANGFATGQSTILLVGRNFDFGSAIPPLNTPVAGIVATINRMSAKQNGRDAIVSLWRNGLRFGNNMANLTLQWPAALTDAIYGGPTDNWGTNLTIEDVIDPLFGVALQVEKNLTGPAVFKVDYMTMTVYW